MFARIGRGASGLFSAGIFYPLAEAAQKRDVRSKVAELRAFYAQSAPMRREASKQRLVGMLSFAGANVPYYRDLFAQHGFDPASVGQDPRRLGALPILTKDIILEQGPRLLSQPLSNIRHHACKSGGSTGEKVMVYYDQSAADFASAVTTYARGRIGAGRTKPALHFAARFPGTMAWRDKSREWVKCLAMNRSNVFFSALDGAELDAIWQSIQRRRPYLVHAHPSTMYLLAHHIKDRGPRSATARNVFEVFESSGELLEKKHRKLIAEVFGCRVVDRYGLSELGVIGYELFTDRNEMMVLESECWAESLPASDGQAPQLIATGLRNRLMPLIRYDTGDLAQIAHTENGPVLTQMLGRIHDVLHISGVRYLTHHVQDILDNRIRGVRDFQIDTRTTPPVLRIVPEPEAVHAEMQAGIDAIWPGGFEVAFVKPEDMIRVGARTKFRHVVSP